ncbi:MAG: hypothetical protein PF445_03220 [Melioribacteraceae bacterium]|nr:hypothetical protein [Melioribacteraceae bacterium]
MEDDEILIANEDITELDALVSSMKKSKKLIASIRGTVDGATVALGAEDLDTLRKF